MVVSFKNELLKTDVFVSLIASHSDPFVLHICIFKSVSEEAVNEVKRQAMSELQKAVAEAERKAHDMISTERAKMERTVAEAKRQAAEDALSIINQQEDSSEVNVLTHTLFSPWVASVL